MSVSAQSSARWYQLGSNCLWSRLFWMRVTWWRAFHFWLKLPCFPFAWVASLRFRSLTRTVRRIGSSKLERSVRASGCVSLWWTGYSSPRRRTTTASRTQGPWVQEWAGGLFWGKLSFSASQWAVTARGAEWALRWLDGCWTREISHLRCC